MTPKTPGKFDLSLSLSFFLQAIFVLDSCSLSLSLSLSLSHLSSILRTKQACMRLTIAFSFLLSLSPALEHSFFFVCFFFSCSFSSRLTCVSTTEQSCFSNAPPQLFNCLSCSSVVRLQQQSLSLSLSLSPFLSLTVLP